MPKGETLEARFWNLVDKRNSAECWPFMGMKNFGYGRLKVSKNRQYKPSKELNSQAKLSNKDVDFIRECKNFGVKTKQLTFAFNVNKGTINSIYRGASW